MTHWLDERMTQEEADDLYAVNVPGLVAGIIVALTILALIVGLS